MTFPQNLYLLIILTNNWQFSNIASYYLEITSCRWLKEKKRLLFSVTGIDNQGLLVASLLYFAIAQFHAYINSKSVLVSYILLSVSKMYGFGFQLQYAREYLCILSAVNLLKVGYRTRNHPYPKSPQKISPLPKITPGQNHPWQQSPLPKITPHNNHPCPKSPLDKNHPL